MDHARFCRGVVFRGVPGINNVMIFAVPALCENAPTVPFFGLYFRAPLPGADQPPPPPPVTTVTSGALPNEAPLVPRVPRLWAATYTGQHWGNIPLVCFRATLPIRCGQEFWLKGGQYHYHHGMKAGENTLELYITRLIMRSIVEDKKVDLDKIRQRYCTFMTTPGVAICLWVCVRARVWAVCVHVCVCVWLPRAGDGHDPGTGCATSLYPVLQKGA